MVRPHLQQVFTLLRDALQPFAIRVPSFTLFVLSRLSNMLRCLLFDFCFSQTTYKSNSTQNSTLQPEMLLFVLAFCNGFLIVPKSRLHVTLVTVLT